TAGGPANRGSAASGRPAATRHNSRANRRRRITLISVPTGSRHGSSADILAAQSLTRRSRSALETTETELIAIAAPAKIGESSSPKNGYRTPAANGTP